MISYKFLNEISFFYIILWFYLEFKGRKIEFRKKKTEDRRPKTEEVRQQTEDGRPETEDGRNKIVVRVVESPCMADMCHKIQSCGIKWKKEAVSQIIIRL